MNRINIRHYRNAHAERWTMYYLSRTHIKCLQYAILSIDIYIMLTKMQLFDNCYMPLRDICCINIAWFGFIQRNHVVTPEPPSWWWRPERVTCTATRWHSNVWMDTNMLQATCQDHARATRRGVERLLHAQVCNFKILSSDNRSILIILICVKRSFRVKRHPILFCQSFLYPRPFLWR